MKKVTKKIVALLSTLAITSTIAFPVFAATPDTWANSWYTPYTGSVAFRSTYVSGTGLKWSASQLLNWNILNYWELEFRPYMGASSTNPVDISDIYVITYTPDLVSGLPGAYYEFSAADLEDVSIGCENPDQLVANQSYQAFLYLAKNPSCDSSQNYHALVESEYGIYETFVVNDGLPYRYAQWKYIPLNSTDSWVK